MFLKSETAQGKLKADVRVLNVKQSQTLENKFLENERTEGHLLSPQR